MQKTFEILYNLDLQLESEGLILPSLSAVLSVDPVFFQVNLRMKPRVIWDSPVHKRVLRYPDLHSIGCRMSVRSIATQQGINIAWYAHSPADIRANTAMVIKELLHKRYPLSWWKPFLFRSMTHQGEMSAHDALHTLSLLLPLDTMTTGHQPLVVEPHEGSALHNRGEVP